MGSMNGPLIIDTREPYEYERSHVDGAINISPAEFLSGTLPLALQRVAKDAPIIMYCMTGHRANTCSMILYSQGFTNITNGTNEHRVRQLLQKASQA